MELAANLRSSAPFNLIAAITVRASNRIIYHCDKPGAVSDFDLGAVSLQRCWPPLAERHPSVAESYYNSVQPFKPNKERTPKMDTASIIAELEAERDRFDRAIAALQGSRNSPARTVASKSDGRKRRLSAAARRKIGQAMKKRWAERKKKAAA